MCRIHGLYLCVLLVLYSCAVLMCCTHVLYWCVVLVYCCTCVLFSSVLYSYVVLTCCTSVLYSRVILMFCAVRMLCTYRYVLFYVLFLCVVLLGCRDQRGVACVAGVCVICWYGCSVWAEVIVSLKSTVDAQTNRCKGQWVKGQWVLSMKLERSKVSGSSLKLTS